MPSPLARVLALALALVAAPACKRGPSAAELRGAEYSVRKVHFEGVTRFRPGELDDYLDLRPTDWAPFPEKHYFYEGLLPLDEQRILDVYAAYGYYAARVVDVRVDYLEGKDKVDLTYVIDEGPPTIVRSVTVRWPEGAPPGPPARERTRPLGRAPEIDPHALSRLVVIEEGGRFEVETLQASSQALRSALRSAGHPFASVEELAEVDRATHEARIELLVRPGPFMRIGEIHIEGLETVPRKPVLVEIDFAPGRPYSPSLLDTIERRVHGLGVFSTVSVIPDKPPDEAPEGGEGLLDLTLRVQEGEPQRVRLGLELELEPNRWDQLLSARYSHQNTFRNLYQIALTARAGYAELPNPFNAREHGPIADLGLHAEKQGLLEKRLVWTLDPKFELDVQQGYQYWATQHRFGLSRFFSRWFGLELSHTLRYVDFFAVSSVLAAPTEEELMQGDFTSDELTVLGLDFRDPYTLSYVGVRPTLYIVDSIGAPTNGVVLGAEYRVAGGPFGGDFDYQQITPFVRMYWRPVERVQLSARARVGMIFPFGDARGSPIDLRLYLGGADSVRGWGLRRLAPRVENCDEAAGEDYRRGDCDSIPIGGNSSVLGNVELRVRTWRKLWLATFLDLGDVRPEVARFDTGQWNYSTGGGLRYDSPIGRFRLDVGVRLNETEHALGEPRWAIHFGLGESF